MERSFNHEVLDKAIAPYQDIVGDIDTKQWLENKNNWMYVHNDSVALATYEYPGVYTIHWFYGSETRGRKMLDLSQAFQAKFFEESGAQALRGLTRVDIKGARWAARKLGWKAIEIVTIDGKDYELFCMTRKDFLNG